MPHEEVTLLVKIGTEGAVVSVRKHQECSVMVT